MRLLPLTHDVSLQERELMIAHFQELKGQMNKLREAERERLTKLTLESNAAIKELKRKAEKVPLSSCLLSVCPKLSKLVEIPK